jgi:hypothetical protein
MWQENLMSNLLVIFVLLALFIIIYTKIKNVTLLEMIREIRGGFSEQV